MPLLVKRLYQATNSYQNKIERYQADFTRDFLMQLENKIAMITGAASGVGKEIALVYALNGARIAIVDVDIFKANRVVEEIQDLGGQAIAVSMDVTDENQVNQGVVTIIENFGGIDILISNAGIQMIESLDKLAFADWKKMLAIHLDGAFLTSRACLKHMYASGNGGSIIYMGSVHSKQGSVLKAPYVTAKHGLLGLCKVVAKEGAPYNVRANVICPGFIRTPLVNNQIPQQARELGISEDQVITRMLEKTVDSEFTTMDDVAQTALFIASFKSMALTGQSFIVSHGWHME